MFWILVAPLYHSSFIVHYRIIIIITITITTINHHHCLSLAT
jgi:hypothetical protein